MDSPKKASHGMQVVKRNGQRERVEFDKILRRIQKLAEDNPPLDQDHVDVALVTQKVIAGVCDGVTTK
jgi:transcriptional regulator NrdR family protein